MGNIRLILARNYGVQETRGTYMLMDDEKRLFECCCLELPWLANQPNISCISGGIYPLVKHNTSEHPKCPARCGGSPCCDGDRL